MRELPHTKRFRPRLHSADMPPNTPLFMNYTQSRDMMLTFAKTLGASNPWCFLLLVAVVFAFHPRCNFHIDTKHARWLVASYCAVAGLLHFVSVVIMGSQGPVLRTLFASFFMTFVKRILFPFLFFPFVRWPIYAASIGGAGFVIEVYLSKYSKHAKVEMVILWALVFNAFMVTLSFACDTE